jgi:hypothetical protein
MAMYYTNFKEVFHYLQCKSTHFPYISVFTVRKYMIHPMDFLKNSHLRMTDVETIFRKCARDKANTDGYMNNHLNRAQF